MFKCTFIPLQDLTTYNYYYWFAFPCPLTPTLKVENGSSPQSLSDIPELLHLESLLKSQAQKPNFFIVKSNEKDTIYTLKNLLANNAVLAEQCDELYFGFADPSEYKHPSWLMRVYAAYIFYKWLVKFKPDLINISNFYVIIYTVPA